MHISEAFSFYLTQLEADGRSRHTIRQRERHVLLLARWLADVGAGGEIAALGHQDVARILASDVAQRRADGGKRKATSANALRSSLKAFFSYCHEAGLVAANPARLVKRALCGTPPPRHLRDDERNRLLQVLADAEGPEAERDHTLFHLMLATGVRLSSTLGLDVEDLDLDAGEAVLRSFKGGRVERVFLPRALAEHLRRFVGDRTAGPVFRGRGDARLSARHAQRRFSAWAARARVRPGATPHSLRHSFARSLLDRTHDLLLVKLALHHRSISSTMVYAEGCAERLRAALA